MNTSKFRYSEQGRHSEFDIWCLVTTYQMKRTKGKFTCIVHTYLRVKSTSWREKKMKHIDHFILNFGH